MDTATASTNASKPRLAQNHSDKRMRMIDRTIRLHGYASHALMSPEKQLLRTLVIGYGNLDRADDGVAYHVVNALRRRLGQTALSEENTGLEELGAEVDSIFLVQLSPELMDLMAGYRQVFFVDAHVYENAENLHCAPIIPEYALSSFTHHMTPAMLLALLKLLDFPEPVGHLVSIRGYDFNFHRDISPETMFLVESAVERILRLIMPCSALPCQRKNMRKAYTVLL